MDRNLANENRLRRNLGANVATVRRRRGLTVAIAARAAGVTQPYWTQIENGGRCPKIPVLVRMAAALGVRPATLLRGL